MKFLVVLALVGACAAADVSRAGEAAANIVRSNSDASPEGSQFSYGFETDNKIVAQAQGVVSNFNSDNPSLEVQGSFSYVSPDGTPVQTSYVAGENGYNAEGSHIPVPPPIPELIARALRYIEEHPPAVDKVTGAAYSTGARGAQFVG